MNDRHEPVELVQNNSLWRRSMAVMSLKKTRTYV